MRAALVAMLVWAAASTAGAEQTSRVDGGAALEYCARVVSAGADAIDPEARRLGLDLGAWQSAGDVEALRGVAGSFFPAETRVRTAEFADGRVIVDESAENCFLRGGDPALMQRLQDANGEWQFAFDDRLTRSMVFDWQGVEGGRSVRAMRLGLTRRDPMPLTTVMRAPVDVLPRVSDDVRGAWVRHILDVCVASAHQALLPSAQEFTPYLSIEGVEAGVTTFRSPRGQPQTEFWLGARNYTCSMISSGEHGRLLVAAFDAELTRRGATVARDRTMVFRISAPEGQAHGAGVVLMAMSGGVHAIIIAPGRP